MAEFLVQRFIDNAPNEMTGAWVDEGIATDLKATEAQAAVDKLADPTYPDAVRRAVRWDTAEEFAVSPGPPKTTKGQKRARTPEDP